MASIVCAAIGCGGSGGGYGEAMITAANAEAVASQGVDMVGFLQQMSEVSQGFTEVFGSNQVIPCDSGNLNVSVMDAGMDGVLSTGDYASMNFNQCVLDLGDGLNATLNGSLSLRADLVSGTPGEGPFDLELTASFGSFTMAAFGATIIVNGGFTLDISSDGTTVTQVVSGNSLSATAQAGVQAFSGSIMNFNQTFTYNEETGDYSMSLQADVYSSAVGGTVMYETPVPFTGTEPGDPDSGVMVVTGANGSKLTFTALDDVNVQIDVDLEGDDIIDITINTTWAVLNGDEV